ncbi:carboxypeptidase-like regulatory domain-containing protein [Mucilaginibacter pineti]|nr:carboxypeptidase-like regulatory domain-containing protein [Mucilaginibacter pineti]
MKNRKLFKYRYCVLAVFVGCFFFYTGSAKNNVFHNEMQDLPKVDTAFKTISGRITGANDTAGLINATVCITGTSIKTTTNNKGEFTFNVPINAHSLEIIYLPHPNGYVPINPILQLNYNITFGYGMPATTTDKDGTTWYFNLNEQTRKPGTRFNMASYRKALKEIGTLGEFKE